MVVVSWYAPLGVTIQFSRSPTSVILKANVHRSGDELAMVAAKNRTSQPGYEVCTLDNVVVLVWRMPPTIKGVEHCDRALNALRATHPGKKLGFLTYVEPAAQQGAPPPLVRNALSQMLKTHESALRATVIIYEGTGFKATIVRSVVTAINLASSLKFQSSVSADRASGSAWLINAMQGETFTTAMDVLNVLRNLPQPAVVGSARL